MDEILARQIEKAEAQGWELCVNCRLDHPNPACQFCPVIVRQLMGKPPERILEVEETT